MKKIRSKDVKKPFRQGRQVILPRIKFIYEESKDNEVMVQAMYNRVFEIAKQNILSRRKQQNNL